MSSLSEQNHIDPNDPAYYAPRWLREKSRSQSPASHEQRSEPFKVPVTSSASLDSEFRSLLSPTARHPLAPAAVPEPAGFAHEARRAALFGFSALLVVGVSALVALFFVIMAPGPRQSEAAATTVETTGSTSVRTALPQSGQGERAKPALAEFQAIIAANPAGQNTTQEPQSEQLQRFLQWRQKPAP